MMRTKLMRERETWREEVREGWMGSVRVCREKDGEGDGEGWKLGEVTLERVLAREV